VGWLLAGNISASLLYNPDFSGIPIPRTQFCFFLVVNSFATVHFYNQSKEKGIKATGIGIE
jgi:hypothetical protein